MTTQRQVLITGGSSGIGAGLAARYLATGASVVVTGRDAGRLRATAARLPGLRTVVSDIGSASDRERLAARLADLLPRLDVVVNNAGVQRRVGLAEDGADFAEVQRELDVLLAGPLHLTRLLVPRLLARPSVVVNVTSGGAVIPQPFAPVYAAAKAALHSYTTNLHFALRDTACRVVELMPPAVATGLAGAGQVHGADLHEFCDAVFPLLDGTRPHVGFGPTAGGPVLELLRAEAELFAASAQRFPVAGYAAAG